MQLKAVIHILLAPLSALYGAVLSLRHMLYDDHILPSFRTSIPSICVGNLAVGGTGKTPHVEYLIQLLSEHYHVAVLSRGYGRKTNGFILADEHSTALSIGDEPMQIHTKFPDIPVAVSVDRGYGIRQLQKRIPNLDVVILDDAFQHRQIRCGMNILLTTYDNLYTNDHLLPWGKLRDLKSRSIAADIIVVTKCPDSMQPIDRRVTENNLKLAAFQQLFFSFLRQDALPRDGRPLVITGVANPSFMIDHVMQWQPEAYLLRFRDHHRFSTKDIQTVLELSKQYDYVLTTEKDMMRMKDTSIPEKLGDRLYVLKETIDFGIDNENFDRRILTYVYESIRKQQKRK